MFPSFYCHAYKDYFVQNKDSLSCKDRTVPIINSIPRFVETGAYASLFGDQWKAYSKTQLDSFTGVPISANRLNRCLGEFQNDLSGKLVLEAGCGAGRFTELLLQKGASLVSSDLSSAVEVNIENCPVSDRHIVIQADINEMPYSNETFDIVICMGVIQHTPDPETTIKNLYRLVKAGGTLIIDHYTFTRSYFLRSAPLYRRWLKKKPASFTIPYTQKLINKYLPLHKRFQNNKIMSVILNRISPVVSYYNAFPQLNDNLQREWALLDTHDGLTDYYKHFRNKKEIVKILKESGAINIWCEYGGNGVEARAQKPLQ